MSTSNHLRKEHYSLEEILPLIGNSDNPLVILDGDEIRVNRKSLVIYKEKGLACVRCGITGDYFVKVKDVNCPRWHLVLMAINEDGRSILMTKDHIVPKAKGGGNEIENMQPMCSPCNNHKADTLEDDDDE